MDLKKRRSFFILSIIVVVALFLALGIFLARKSEHADKDYVWSATVGPRGENLLFRGAYIDDIKKNLPSLIEALNRYVGDVEARRSSQAGDPAALPKIRFQGLEEGILRVDVQNDDYLTQRMGSFGADEFLAVATFTLTEYGGVRAVRFDFREGDHAAPGVYTRASFSKHWKISR